MAIYYEGFALFLLVIDRTVWQSVSYCNCSMCRYLRFVPQRGQFGK